MSPSLRCKCYYEGCKSLRVSPRDNLYKGSENKERNGPFESPRPFREYGGIQNNETSKRYRIEPGDCGDGQGIRYVTVAYRADATLTPSSTDPPVASLKLWSRETHVTQPEGQTFDVLSIKRRRCGIHQYRVAMFSSEAEGTSPLPGLENLGRGAYLLVCHDRPRMDSL